MRSKIKQQKIIAACIFTLPALSVIAIFFISPVLQSFYYSFTNWDGISSSYDYVGFKNYVTIFNARQSMAVIRNTFYLAVIYIPILNIIALLLAVMIKGSFGKLQNLFKSVLFFPNLLALAVIGYVWVMLLNPLTGAFNMFLKSVGLDFLAVNWLGTIQTVLPTIGAITLWYAAGFYMIIYYAGLMGIPQELYEAASIDGASRWKQFRYVTLAMIRPSITINVILSTIGILSVFDLPFVMTKGGPGYHSTTIALQIFFYNTQTFQMAPGVALSVVLCLICIVITAILFRITTRKEVN